MSFITNEKAEKLGVRPALFHSAVQLGCTTLAYIIRRGAVYYLNLRLPRHLCPHRSTLRLSLRVRERKIALFLASALAHKLHEYLGDQPLTDPRKLLLLCAKWRDDSPTPTLHQQPHRRCNKTASTASDNSPMLSTLSKLYIDEGKRGGTWRTVSALDVERALRDFFLLMGDMPASTFDIENARTLKERLSRYPQYFGLRPEFEGKTLLDVVESAKIYKAITPVTINNRLRRLSAFFNWCRKNGYMPDNPLSGVRVMTGPAKDARLSFESDDLSKLLNLESLQKEARNHPWRYWLPLLGRATGARLEELCQLYLDDITTLQGTLCIHIDDCREGQKLKNESSRRTIPIHPALIELGLLDHITTVRRAGATRLFPELQPTRDKLSHAPSKWFSRYKAKHGIQDPRKTFHSVRHTFIDELRDAGVQDSLIRRLMGHEDSSITFGVYGSRAPIQAMLAAVQSLRLDQPFRQH